MLEVPLTSKSEVLNKSLQIGGWTVFPNINHMVGPTGKSNIGNRSMRLLMYLHDHEGVVISKNELLKNIWHDVAVTEDSLTKSVSELRRVLGKPQDAGIEITTIRGVGYSLVRTQLKSANRSYVHSIFSGKGLVALIILLIGTFLYSKMDMTIEKKLVNLTNNEGEQRVPRLSPDGSKLLYAAIFEGWNHFNIYIQDLNNGTVKAITSAQSLDTDPIWSPDGGSIAYLRNNGSGVSIVTKDLEEFIDKELTTISNVVGLSAMAWSPLDDMIVYADQGTKGQTYALYGIDRRTLSKIRLTDPPRGIIGDSSPRLSPNGENLSFIRTIKSGRLHGHLIPGIGEVFIKKNDEEEIQLTNLNTEISGVAWVDNRTVIFSAAYQNYMFRIYEMDIVSQSLRVVHQTKELVRNLDYHEESKQIVFESWDANHTIWTFAHQKSLDFSSHYFEDASNYWRPRFNKTGNKFAYISDKSGTAELWIRDTKKELDLKITSKSEGIIQSPEWSSDGRSLMYEVISDSGNYIYIYSLEQNQSKLLTVSHGIGSFPHWSEDQKSFYYSSNISGRHEIYKSDLEDPSNYIQVTSRGGLRCIEFGENLYYTKIYDAGIWLKTEYGEIKILEHPSFQDFTNWELHDNTIYFIKRDHFFRPELFSYQIDSKVISLVQGFNYPMSIDFAGFSIHPNDNTFLITLNTKKRSDIKQLHLDL